MSKSLTVIFSLIFISGWSLSISAPLTVAEVSNESTLKKMSLGKEKIAILWTDYCNWNSEYLNIVFKEKDQWTKPVRLNEENQKLNSTYLSYDEEGQCNILYSGKYENHFAVLVQKNQKWNKPSDLDEIFEADQTSYVYFEHFCIANDKNLVLIEEIDNDLSFRDTQLKSWVYNPKENILKTNTLGTASYSTFLKLITSPSGDPYVFWVANKEMRIFKLEVDSSWKEISRLLLPKAENYQEYPVQIDSFGNISLIYEDYSDNLFEACLDSEGNWNHSPLPSALGHFDIVYKIDTQGNRIAVVADYDCFHTAHRSQGGEWIRGENLPGGKYYSEFLQVESTENHFILVWEHWNTIYGKTFSFPDQKWSAKVPLIENTESAIFRVQEDGKGIIAWIEDSKSEFNPLGKLKVAEILLEK